MKLLIFSGIRSLLFNAASKLFVVRVSWCTKARGGALSVFFEVGTGALSELSVLGGGALREFVGLGTGALRDFNSVPGDLPPIAGQ